ncbi:MAG: hypothetical protein IJE43_19445 [Alphaproteobacteria bacterium]|nr:hypothetical protein [Alphaproteobacteria bacterium]
MEQCAKMDYKTAMELNQKNQAEFISIRTQQEIGLQNFLKGIYSIDAKRFEGRVELKENLTLKDLVPEYYAAEPRQEVLDAQIKETNEYLQKLNEIIREILEEAIKCNSNYQALASSGR